MTLTSGAPASESSAFVGDREPSWQCNLQFKVQRAELVAVRDGRTLVELTDREATLLKFLLRQHNRGMA